ncbi:HD-GYP domain-containing protein [Pseudodesulfovibrio piezophilus]|uniref:Metal dependent phosphohydrolase n=1 Tax=Pseudodesulfovibrio piezophilus (strain DSM 21447 / JCM 15486 / C1TLV30) TaxID=1322246 RepID=M1WM57_PSEP2
MYTLATDATPRSTPPKNEHEILHQFLISLGKAIDAKDAGTGSHSSEVARIAEAIGWAMGITGKEIRWLSMAGLLHDIGKIGIPDSILSKPGPLNDEEWEIIKTHPGKGEAIVRPVEEFGKKKSVADIVRHHHERFDGLGYPDGLMEEEIPLGARIVAVADSISTMLQDRPYQAGRNFDEAMEEILVCAGTRYDPDVVEALMSVREDIKHILPGIDR